MASGHRRTRTGAADRAAPAQESQIHVFAPRRPPGSADPRAPAPVRTRRVGCEHLTSPLKSAGDTSDEDAPDTCTLLQNGTDETELAPEFLSFLTQDVDCAKKVRYSESGRLSSYPTKERALLLRRRCPTWARAERGAWF